MSTEHSVTGNGWNGGGWADSTIKLWQGRDGKYDTRGENSRTAKLTAAQVAIIKAAPQSGPARVSTSMLARQYGVSHMAIKRVREGTSWVNVPAGTWPPDWWDTGG